MMKTAVFVSALAFGLALAAVAQGVACGTKGAAHKVSDRQNNAGANGDRLANGVWGGDHVRMEVSDAGAAVEFDCAHGSIEQTITLDPDGAFDIKATYVPERGGPVRRDAPPPLRPARYKGKVAGDTLTLAVTLTDNGEDAGTYTLTRGSDGHVMKCR